MFDEPMVGLDPHHSRVLKDILREQADAGVTVFVSTHQLSVAEEMADRIGIMHQGRLVAVGSHEELQAANRDSTLESIFLSLTDDDARTPRSPFRTGGFWPGSTARKAGGGVRRRWRRPDCMRSSWACLS